MNLYDILEAEEDKDKSEPKRGTDKPDFSKMVGGTSKGLLGKPVTAVKGGAAALLTMGKGPIKGIIGAATELLKKKHFMKILKGAKKTGKVIRTVYAYAVAPQSAKQRVKDLIRNWPNLKFRILNIWQLIYPDIDEPNDKYTSVTYSSMGIKLHQSTLNKDDEVVKQYLKDFTKEQAVEPKEIEEPKEASEELVMSVNDTLGALEEEILTEAFGLPPITALLARWKYTKQIERLAAQMQTGLPAPALIRHRLWVAQVYDTARNKTYLHIFDGISKEQPIQKMEFEGKYDYI